MTSIGKWFKTIEIIIAKLTAYRLNFFLQVLGPFLVFFFVKYNLWTAIYQDNYEIILKGFTLNEMIQYHLWVMILGLIGNGYTGWDLSQEIRLGRVSTYLIYPFNLWEFHTASFLAFQVMQILISLFTLSVTSFFGIIEIPSIEILLIGYLYIFFVSLMWFSIQYFTGILAFWVEQTWMIRVLINHIAIFLSGALLPLSFFPESVTALIKYTPFPYMIYVPTQYLMGEQVSLLFGAQVIAAWMLIFLGLNILVWRRGLKLYSGAGM